MTDRDRVGLESVVSRRYAVGSWQGQQGGVGREIKERSKSHNSSSNSGSYRTNHLRLLLKCEVKMGGLVAGHTA